MGGGSSPAHAGGISGGPAKGGLGGEPAAAGGNSQTGAASNALSYGSLKNRFVAASVIANKLLMYLVCTDFFRDRNQSRRSYFL